MPQIYFLYGIGILFKNLIQVYGLCPLVAKSSKLRIKYIVLTYCSDSDGILLELVLLLFFFTSCNWKGIFLQWSFFVNFYITTLKGNIVRVCVCVYMYVCVWISIYIFKLILFSCVVVVFSFYICFWCPHFESKVLFCVMYAQHFPRTIIHIFISCLLANTIKIVKWASF